MEKYQISRHGSKQTIVNFTGLPQSTINDWVNRTSHPNYELCQKLIDDLVKAQAKVLERWSNNKKMQAAISKTRQKRK